MNCSKCQQDLPAEAFFVRKSAGVRGRVSQCRTCWLDRARTVDAFKPGRRKSWMKGNAAKRGIAWELSDDQFMALWQRPCFYCAGEVKTVGIDRLDNARGYTVGNCVSCCSVCNAMKSKLPYERFVAQCTRIATNMTANQGIACESEADSAMIAAARGVPAIK